MIRSLLSGLAILLVTSSVAVAAPDYRCVIKEVATANPSSSDTFTFNIGREFTVERRSGVIAGAVRNRFFTDPVVVDPGSDSNAYKVVSTLRLGEGEGVGSIATLLTINEYEDTPEKAFLFADGDVAYFGSCVHF